MYSKEEVFESTLEYFQGDTLATQVWINKYCLKDQVGNLLELNPNDMHIRLASEFARIESKYSNPLKEREIYNLLKDFKYIIPQGSPMEGIGNYNKFSTLSNCYVIDSPRDSYSGILTTEREMIELYKRRGGVGLSLDTLRPKDMPTSSVSEKSSGLVLFGERYSNTTREVAQDGRRGALMETCRVDHPDIEYFIDAKMEQGKISGANMSVLISDDFMNAVENKEEYNCYWKGFAGEINEKKDAEKVWNKIIHNAWQSAEPGVIFWDTVLRESIPSCYGEEWKERSTNPCSELPLCQYDSCRLLVLNLYSYVDNPFTSGAKFNFKLFRQHVDYAQRLLDDLIDLEIEKIDRIIEKIENDDDKDDDKTIELNLWNKIKKKAIEGRRTGLGITAEGDMLAALGLIYGTDAATNFSENLHKILAIESYKSSIQMAKERGSFPIWNYDKEKNNPFIKRIIKGMSLREDEPTYEIDDLLVISDYKQYGRRNIANLTIAPTGSVSILTQTTSGIEPVFKVSYKRRRKVTEKDKATFIDEVGDMWEEYNVFHHKFIDWYYKSNLNRDLSNSYLKERFECEKFLNQLSDEALNEIIKISPYYKATSEDVDYLGKVEMQGRIQKWIDHSISVTVNMPKDVTEQMVSDVYMKAYKTGCKGLTVYRDGSRSGVLVSNDKKEEVFPEERPREVMCEINHLTIQGVKWIVLVGILNSKPYEVFCLRDQEILKKYKTGRLIKVRSRVYDLQVDDDGTIHNIVGEFTNPLEGALTRQISLNLKHTPLEDIYLQLQKEGNISDFNKAISRVFKKYLKDKDLKAKCPECKSNLSMEGGCIICKNCGYSECN